MQEVWVAGMNVIFCFGILFVGAGVGEIAGDYETKGL